MNTRARARRSTRKIGSAKSPTWGNLPVSARTRSASGCAARGCDRSSAGSRLVILYLSPSRLIRALGVLTRVTDEPLRSLFAPDDMRALVERFGFAVTSDEPLPAVARRLSDDVRGVGWAVESQRVVVADRASQWTSAA